MKSFVRLFFLFAVAVGSVLAQEGGLDTTFGGNGTKIVAFNGIAYAHDMAVQPDNKIIVVGSCRALEVSYVPFCAARVNEDGSTDTSFKGGYPFFSAYGVYTLFAPSYEGAAEGVALQPDGKVIVVGSGPGGRVAVVRYTSTGQLDSEFGLGGVTLDPVGKAERVALQPDGKIVVVGSGPAGVFAARYHSNGTIDSSFGTAGVATISVDGGSTGQSIAVQPDGRIVVGGIVPKTGSYLLARFAASGQPDGSWDGDGIRVISPDPFGPTFDLFEGIGIRAIGIQKDGRVIAVGHQNILFSFNSDGTPDTSFDNDGRRPVMNGFDKETYGLTIDAGGKIIVVGTAVANVPQGPDPIPQPPFVYHTARFNPDGTLDTTWGSAGYRTVALELAAGAFSVATDPVGRVVVAGVGAAGLPNLPWLNFRFSVARLLGPPAIVGISGRVTDASGNPIRNTVVQTEIDGAPVAAITNPFGYYTISGVTTGQSYLVIAKAKGRSFAPQNVTVTNQFATVNFIAF